MAMTIQQAQMEAMRLRARRPELQNMAVSDLIERIMATEGAPGAGGGGLADIFQPARVITPSSPAPMQVARLAAPKPTANIVPGVGADSFRRAQEVRQRTDRGPTVGERSAANARVQELIAGLPTGGGESAPEVIAAAPVRATAPEAAAEAAPKARAVQASRYRPLLEQAEADLQKLDAQQQAIAAQGGTAPPELVSKFENLSGKVSQLKSMVAAEEGAVVSAERAAVMERQTQRLAREKELIEQARKRAPFDALIAGGAALAGAKPGESFASALARGLQAGSQSYTGARDAREVGLRGIEERRDAIILQNEDAIEKARADAIALAKTGVELDAQQLALTKLRREDVKSLATQKFDIDLAEAKASSAQTEAKYAPQVYEAEIDSQRALAEERRRPPASSGGSGTGGISTTQAGLRGAASKKDLTDLEKMIIESDENEDHANTEQLLNQYRATRDAFNRNAVAAGRAPITVKGFPVKLSRYEEYVRKNKRHPSGKTYTMPGQGGGKPAVTGGQARPAGVGNDWRLETDRNGNRAWVNPSRTKFVEI
jgi:hypothetical protein